MRGAGAAAALTAVILVAGCGSSGGSSSSTTRAAAPVSKAAFIVTADAVCRGAESALAPVLARETATLSAKPPKRAAAAHALNQAATIVAAGLANLKALPQPRDGQRLLATVYGALGREARSLRALAKDVAAAKRTAEKADVAATGAASTLYTSSSAQFGFKRCGVHAGTG